MNYDTNPAMNCGADYGVPRSRSHDSHTANRNLLSALDAIDVTALSYEDWLRVGMALRREGFACDVWEDWSRNDARFHEGECARKWATFDAACASPVTGGTILHLAKEQGWDGRADTGSCPGPRTGRQDISCSGWGADPDNACLSWDDELSDPADSLREDGLCENGLCEVSLCERGNSEDSLSHCRSLTPVQQLEAYLRALFRPEDIVGYVTGDVFYNGSGKYCPLRGVCRRTAGELLATLAANPQDLRDTVGPWREDTGAWIRLNPLDGKGVKNSNVTAYRYALVESDTLEPAEQERILRSLRLPIAALVYSGGRSVHAAVHIDASTPEEYKSRVEYLYDFLDARGLSVDRQNRNPSRLSRMPGVTRGGREQTLLGVNIGCRSWNEWQQWLKEQARRDALQRAAAMEIYGTSGRSALSGPAGATGGTCSGGGNGTSCPDGSAGPTGPAGSTGPTEDAAEPEAKEDFSFLNDYIGRLPEPPEELISGVLRRGHKMLISGPSKAGKSFLLIELCIALSEGRPWLGFPCRKSRVLYINLEIDPASCVRRFFKIYEALGIRPDHAGDIAVWNLRGRAKPLDRLVPDILQHAEGQHFDVIILDPIYKIITGDENNASDMGYFSNQFDILARKTGCSIIYCHHHSKGVQGQKKAQDRASGSGVFSRDPDAQLDMIQLELSEDLRHRARDRNGTATAWRLESSLREFANFEPRNFWFRYPLHVLDGENLDTAPSEGSFEAVRARNHCATTKEDRRASIYSAWQNLGKKKPTLRDIAEYNQISVRAVRDRIRDMPGEFYVRDSIVYRGSPPDEDPEEE